MRWQVTLPVMPIHVGRLLVRPKAAFHVVAPSTLAMLSETRFEAAELFVDQT